MQPLKVTKQIGDNQKVIINDVVYTDPVAVPCEHGNFFSDYLKV